MAILPCVGKDGASRTFECKDTLDALSSTWTYRVTTIPPPPTGDFFELAVKEVDASAVSVVMARHHNRPEYAAMGIPDALLPMIKSKLNREVRSSPTRGVGGVYRTPDATKYWERLCKAGLASYDAQTDIYVII